jgi:hypothetical protein
LFAGTKKIQIDSKMSIQQVEKFLSSELGTNHFSWTNLFVQDANAFISFPVIAGIAFVAVVVYAEVQFFNDIYANWAKLELDLKVGENLCKRLDGELVSSEYEINELKESYKKLALSYGKSCYHYYKDKEEDHKNLCEDMTKKVTTCLKAHLSQLDKKSNLEFISISNQKDGE